jgi:hypothetical protein
MIDSIQAKRTEAWDPIENFEVLKFYCRACDRVRKSTFTPQTRTPAKLQITESLSG